MPYELTERATRSGRSQGVASVSASAETMRSGPALDELRASARLALPVVAVQLGMLLMGPVDTIMLGRLSAQALAAGAIGNIVSFTLLMFAAGTLAALDP